MRRPKTTSTQIKSLCVLLTTALVAFAGADGFRTTSFSANMRINADRTITVDETILIVPSGTAAINLVVAEAPEGSRKVQYLVNRATTGSDKSSVTPLEVKPDSDGNLATSFPAGSLKGPVQIHVNYSVLGAFTDKSGGSLGARSTLSWDLVPTKWPSKIESGLLEVGYPTGAVPIYAGVNSGAGDARQAIEKSPNTAFTGAVSAFNVSEVRDGITLQPASIPASAGLHLLIAIARKDLKPAPEKLIPPVTLTVSHSAPQRGAKPQTGAAPTNRVQTLARTAPSKQGMTLWMVALPLLVPIAFFFIFSKRLSFMTGHGYATSAVPEGVGPAEAGYLLEGSLKVRHVLGAVSAVVAGHYSQPDSATIDPAAIGPVERKAIEILKRRTATGDTKEIKVFLSGSMQDLQSILIQNLISLNMLESPSTAGRFGPLLGSLVALAITGAVSVNNDTAVGGVVTGLAVILTATLLYSLGSLSQRGVKAKLKVMGLHRFLTAHAQELKSGTDLDYLAPLKPYAVAFGLAKEDQF